MAVTANDVQLWLWKIVKLSSQNGLFFMLKYPFISCSLSFLLLLYIFFRLVFWVFIYSSPLVVVVVIAVLRIYGNGKKYRESEKKEENDVGHDVVAGAEAEGKPFRRVHSVRRRRAMYSLIEDSNVEEKVAVSSTGFVADQVVDKSTLIEESTIRDVQIDSSVSSVMDPLFVASQDSKPEFGGGSIVESLEVSSKGSEDDEKEVGKEDRNKEVVEWTEEDENNVTEVGISEIERNKRLESLIARRRARKLLSLQVRKTLVNIERNELTAPLASLVIPKHSNNSGPPNVSGQVSLSPGSAPSVLVPMRNPFDLPYDPQEEKPDLTGDGFHQEFISPPNKDMVYCRHESFNVGPFLPEDFSQSRDKAVYREGFGFRHRAFQQGSGFYTSGTQFYNESTRTLEAKPIRQSEANFISDSEDDHIKEVIQVHQNDIENNDDKDDKEVETNSLQATSSSSTSTVSSSTEEEPPFFKIDKDVVLKNLFSPRTTAAQGKAFNDQVGENSGCVPSPSRLGRNTLEEHMYRANRFLRRHGPSYSIASDLQVELSEVSSSITIDDIFSYRDEDIETYDTDMELNFSSASGNDLRSRDVDDISERDILEVGYSRNNNFGDLPSPSIPVDQFLQGNKTQSWSSLPLIPELNDSDPDPESLTSFSSDSLEEQSHESLSISARANQRQSTSNSSSHLDKLPKQVDYNTVEIKQLDTHESKTIAHIEEQSDNPYECHHMKHSTQHNIMSSEYSEERLRLASEHEEKRTTAVVDFFETPNNFDHENQLYEGEPSSSAQGGIRSFEDFEERLRATPEHESKMMTTLDFETHDNYEHEDQLYEGELSFSAQGNIASSKDLEERLRPTSEHEEKMMTTLDFNTSKNYEHEDQLYKGEPSSSSQGNMASSEDLEERLMPTSEHEEITMTTLDFKTSDNYEHDDQLYEGESSSSAQGNTTPFEDLEERLKPTSYHEGKTMATLDFETSDNDEHKDQIHKGEPSSSAQYNIAPYEDLGERLRPTSEPEDKTTRRVIFEFPDHSEHEYQHYEGEPSSSAPTTLESDDSLSVSQTTNVEIQGDSVPQSSSTSPKSVLHQSFSVDLGSTTSFDHYDQETQRLVRNNIEVLSPTGSLNSSSTTENLVDDPVSYESIGDIETTQGSVESLERPISGAVNIDFVHENAINTIEVDSGNAQPLSIHDALSEQFIPNDETGLSSFTNDNETSIKIFEAMNPVEYGETIVSDNNLESLISDEVAGNVANHDGNNKLSYVDGIESSGLCEDTGHEQHDDNSVQGIKNSPGSNHFEVKQEEPQNLSILEAHRSASMEGNDISKSSEKSEHASQGETIDSREDRFS